jgi:two-component system CheB/CheR fusion protein
MPASGSRVAMSETDESKQHHGGVKPSALQHNLTLDEGGEKRFHDLLNLLPAAVYTTDAAGRITFYNETAAVLWGRRPTLNVDTCCGSARMYWPDGTPLPYDQCPMTVVLKGGRAVAGQEAVVERPDGTQMPFMAFPSALRDPTGQIVGAVNMFVDITERKRNEEIAQRLASIVESSDDAIISKSLDGTITSWNNGAARLFGYVAEEIIGKPGRILIPPDRQDEEDAIIERVSSGERIEHYETVRLCKDGKSIEISITVSPIRNAQGKIIGASKIARDISERKRSEAQVAILAREAEHRAKNVLANVQATVRLSQSDTPEGLKQAIEGRIQALANVHTLFVQTRWKGAELHSLVTQELSPYRKDGETRVRSDGPNVLLEPQMAQTIAVTLHELATNAAKYGALSSAKGHVEVGWSLALDGRIVLRWTETGGPPVKPPRRRGFGTRVMEGMIRGQLKGEMRFDWRAEGLACEIVLPGQKI